MKHIHYLFILFASLLTLTTSCADEGPELIGKMDVDVEVISTTPQSVTLKVTIPQRDNLVTHLQQATLQQEGYDNGNYGDILPIINENEEPTGDYYVTFAGLSPSSSYKLWLELQTKFIESPVELGYGHDWWAYQRFNWCYGKPITTAKAGDFSAVKVPTKIVSTTDKTAILRMACPTGYSWNASDNDILFRCGTSENLDNDPNVKHIRWREKDSQSSGDGYISNIYNDSIQVVVTDLEPSKQYYFDLVTELRSLWNDEATGTITIKPEISSFSTTAAGTFPYKNETSVDVTCNYTTSWASGYDYFYQLEVSFYMPAEIELAYRLLIERTGNPGTNKLVYSTDPTFKKDVKEIDLNEHLNGWNTSFTIDKPDVAGGTTYYYYVETSFFNNYNGNWYNGNISALYQDVRLPFNETGYGSFTTAAS